MNSKCFKKAIYLYRIKKNRRTIMGIELMTKQELSSVKRRRWIYREGEWYWIEDAG